MLHPLLIPKVEIQRPTTALRVGKFNAITSQLEDTDFLFYSKYTEIYRAKFQKV